jgi:hypothetical protein
MRETPDCEKYQDELDAHAARIARIEKVLSDTKDRGLRGFNPQDRIYFMPGL